MKKMVFVIIALCIFVLGCNNEVNRHVNNPQARVQISNLDVDNYFVKGTNLQDFDKVPERIVVVGENETETLLALGVPPQNITTVYQSKRAYNMQQKNWERFQKVKKVPLSKLNMEYITSLAPEIIVAEQCMFIQNRLKNTRYWNDYGVKTMVPLNSNSPSKHIHNETVSKEMQFVRDLGKVFACESKAETIINGVNTTIEKVRQKTVDKKQPKVMIVEFLSTMICYDNTKLVGNMAESLGCKVEEHPAVISYENVVKENPEVLFVVCSHGDYGKCIENITKNPGLQHIDCVRNKRVYSIPLRFTYGTGCRTEDGLKFLAERIYPEIKGTL